MVIFITALASLFAMIVREQALVIKSFDSEETLIGPWIYSRARRQSDLNYNSMKDSYERALNESIADYYAQRKAVMDRYYSRQREISEGFSRNLTSFNVEQPDRSHLSLNNSLINTVVTTEDNSVDYYSTVKPEELPDIARDGQGYERQGECKRHLNEQLVYQHNLSIGLKGPSQLDATIKVNLDGPITITCVEAAPYNNSSGILSWLAGGPGTHFVKLNLKALKNKGVSYTIKVWGIKTKHDENH